MAQDRTPGQRVKVGFLTLQVLAKIPTPGDWLPDAYVLRNDRNAFYRFIPHNGLHRFNSLEAAVIG